MYKIRLLSAAECELEDITDYSFKHWGAKRAKKTLVEFETLFWQITRFPENGHSIEKSAAYKKAAPKLPFLVLYRIDHTVQEVVVVQIIYMSRNQ
jgi:plasmid stabilization system protein ParE